MAAQPPNPTSTTTNLNALEGEKSVPLPGSQRQIAQQAKGAAKRPAQEKPNLARPNAARPTVAAPQMPAVAKPQLAPQETSVVDTAAIWKDFFNNWPEGIPTRGIVVNQLSEQLPFKAYMLKGDVLMLERTNPDTMGSRYLLVPFCEIGIVKLTEPLNQEKFEKAGFKGKLFS